MSRIPYYYRLIRYTHSQTTGEGLNVGLLLVAPANRWLSLRMENRYHRLSVAFPGFDGHTYRMHVTRLLARAKDLASEMQSDQLCYEGLSADRTCARLIPDLGFSFSFGEERIGLCVDLEAEIGRLFAELIESYQASSSKERRSDDDLWASCMPALEKQGIPRALQPKLIVTSVAEHEFQHAYKNSRWHAIEPVSLDYVNADDLGKKARDLAGLGVALRDSKELGTVNLILGKPQLGKHKTAYGKAKDLLHRMPVPHKIIEEDEFEDYSRQLASEMKEHGVLPESRAAG